jgi:cytochrome oxidase Cu insertion factor (SCO1/SenC/PrrC family)
MARTDGKKEKVEIVEVSHDDEDDLIDEEQLDEYREMIEQLGSFPVS